MKFSLLIALLSLFLFGCGVEDVITDTSSDGETVEQMGFAESELYNPVTNPTAPYLTAGKTAILSIEAEYTEQAEGDTLDAGNDSVWIKTSAEGTIGMEMEDADLELIDHVQIFDETGSPRLDVDRDNRTAEATLPAGVYEFRFHAGHSDTVAKPLFVSFQDASSKNGRAASASAVNVLNTCRYCNLTGVTIKNLNFIGSDLYGSTFSYATISGVNFLGANLVFASFSESSIKDTSFDQADVSYAHFSFSTMNNCSFTNATARYTFFYNLSMSNSLFSGTNLDNAVFQSFNSAPRSFVQSDVSTDPTTLNFENCSMYRTFFYEANITESKMIGCSLTDATFKYSSLVRTDFTGSNLTGVTLYYSNYNNVILSYATWIDGRKCSDPSIGGCY